MHKIYYDFLVFIGRFQPFHNGHREIISRALKLANNVIILCGSAKQPRSIRNPWLAQEREIMIRSSFSDLDNQRILISPLADNLYNDALWINDIKNTVTRLTYKHYNKFDNTPRIGLIGHSKDQTSYYLNLFSEWCSENVENYHNINATSIREQLFSSPSNIDDIKQLVPESVYNYLRSFVRSKDFILLREEYNFIKEYKESWRLAPYAPILVTVDALVVHSNKVLLVKRSSSPGKGLWALPGGFVEQNENLFDACVRELIEETKVSVSLSVLKNSLITGKVFDDPNRSLRVRTMTHVFYIKLQDSMALPIVQGSDDAEEAIWRKLDNISSTDMAEDHYFIIQNLLNENK
ncbi:Bifunctional NMN adenylyltransferase/Nudix hydrolase [Rickettsiales bacterium Ac37b]|nr:Bifunctional NMN adenylyltransferase/Nudix hydrolase [Rickettsiales bacterium Ac37b]